jgi:hypothetical protein
MIAPCNEAANPRHEGTAAMTDSIHQMQALLYDVVELLKVSNNANKRAAARKLDSIANLASTLSATVQAQR